MVQLVDRQEKGADTDKSAVQQLEQEYGIPIEPIIGVRDILAYLKEQGGYEEELKRVEAYTNEFGAV